MSAPTARRVGIDVGDRLLVTPVGACDEVPQAKWPPALAVEVVGITLATLVQLGDSKGEASLSGHLKADGDEYTGSQSYIPPNPKNDKALTMAVDLLRGVTTNAAFPPDLRRAPRN